ncbi:nuclear transport factor 2 family protein [Nonomuraea sp. NEAU-A123]|uniref:nuclear transport factor 2 family protein n=1 Tax=Nonomuraea sp. NEAU-A123 TaxID=2839649 RepID=UPI001BE496E4|nr:nuclear transport factor 2 family protein [Nonomuraea sp. NEAU-A123]MBT2233543.1 nuclear transport factor 2 family protein [Nonomuraea sp. NEAU-A123]
MDDPVDRSLETGEAASLAGVLPQLPGRQEMTEVSAGTLAEMLDERQHLLEVALWMFGSDITADRIVQETYRRWYALGDEERAGIAVPRAWLTRVAGGICLELLAADTPIPAPVNVPQPVAAPVTGTSARRPGPVTGRVRCRAGDGPGAAHHQAGSHQAMLARHDRVARRFAAACDTGDTAALRAVLATDAMVVSDGGGKLRAAIHPTHGADAVARFVTALLAGRPGTEVSVASVNGRTGLVLRRSGQAVAVVGVSVAGAEVTAVWIVLNPDKLRRWHRS